MPNLLCLARRALLTGCILCCTAAPLRAVSATEIDTFLAATGDDARSALVADLDDSQRAEMSLALAGRAAADVRAGRLDAADQVVARMFDLAGREETGVCRARALVARGSVWTRRGRTDEAERDIRAAREMFAAAGDRVGQIDADNQLGRLMAEASHFPEAVATLKGCIAAAAEIGDRSREARGRLNLGETLRLRGDYDAGMASATQARELFLTVGDELGAAEADQNFGASAGLKNDYAAALPAMERALAVYRKLGDEDGIAGILGNLGVVHEMLGDYPRALELHRESVAMRRAQGQRRKEALAQNNIGVLYLFSGRPRDALAEFDACLVIAREVGDRALEQVLLHNGGEALRNCGELGPALERMLAALAIARELGIRPAVAAIRGSIASVYQVAGQFAQAEREFREVAAEFHELDMPMDEATTLQNLGSVLAALGRRDEARALMEQSLAIKRSIEEWNGILVSLEALGRMDLAAGDLGRAGERFAESRDIATRLSDFGGMGRARVGEGEVARRRGLTADAAQCFSSALEMGERYDIADVIVPAACGLAEVERSRAAAEKAVAAYERAIRAIEGSRASLDDPEFKMGFLERNLEAYHALAALHLAAGRELEAWQVIERARARTLLQMLAGSHVDITASLDESERRHTHELDEQLDFATLRWRMLAAQEGADAGELARVVAARDEARRAFDDYRARLHLLHPGLAARQGETAPASLADLEALLPDASAALLEYAVIKDEVWVFIARRPDAGRPIAVHARRVDGSLAEVRAATQELVERCEQRSSAALLDTVRRRMGDLLLAPVLPDLEGVEVLGIAPVDVLWRVPFAALLQPDGKPLIDRLALFTVPSVATWREMTQRSEARVPETAPWALLALANPELGAVRQSTMPLLGGFDAIPGTERQARAIAELFGDRAALFLGRDATEARVRMLGGQADILHLATHAIFDPASPLHSGLLLTPGPADDGYLEAREIMDMSLRAELVVLSACRTAQGDLRGGEGVWGMAWALFAAGAPSSVLTQWEVADESTADGMVAFYRAVRQRLDYNVESRPRFWKARCLREAQQGLRTRRSWGEPFFWAPFVLIGDPG